MKWSKYQEAIFEGVAAGNGAGDLIVQARAGSGKSSSIVESLRHLPPRTDALLVAFNKIIAEELRRRAPRSVEVSTLHSYGYRTIRKKFSGLEVDTKRVRNMVDVLGLTRDMSNGIIATVSAAKNMLVDKDDAQAVSDLVDDLDIDDGFVMPTSGLGRGDELRQAHRDAFVGYVSDILGACMDVKDTIDFDDMIWLPSVLNLRRYQYDAVFVDECQDVNPAQIDLALGAVLPRSGRLVAVGDEKQAIYGWRGASPELLQIEAPTLMLPISYRCPNSVIAMAQKIVPDIEAAPDAPDGVFRRAPHDGYLSAERGDFVLSRLNAPLVGAWIEFTIKGIPASIVGLDVPKMLQALIRKSKLGRHDKAAKLDAWVREWHQHEVIRLEREGRQTTQADDKERCIRHLCRYVGDGSIGDVVSKLDRMYSSHDIERHVRLSSVHRAKGLEADRVFLIGSSFMLWTTQEEWNILYVAVTRAKKELVFCEDGRDADDYGRPRVPDWYRCFECAPHARTPPPCGFSPASAQES